MEKFNCFECGARETVFLQSAGGMVREVAPGVIVEVPPDVFVTRCAACGESYMDEAESARVDAAITMR